MTIKFIQNTTLAMYTDYYKECGCHLIELQELVKLLGNGKYWAEFLLWQIEKVEEQTKESKLHRQNMWTKDNVIS